MHTRLPHICTHVHNAHPFAAAGLRPLANREALWAQTWDDAKGDWVAPSPSICSSVPPPCTPWEQRGRGQDGGRWRVFLNSTMSCPVAVSSTPVLGPHIPEGMEIYIAPSGLGWTALGTGPVGLLVQRCALENGELSVRELNY